MARLLLAGATALGMVPRAAFAQRTMSETTTSTKGVPEIVAPPGDTPCSTTTE
jgi:hypothetical protein